MSTESQPADGSATETMSAEHLVVSATGAVGRIVLNRPDKLNPLSTACLEELAAAARWFDARPTVRAVVVTGAGRAFSAGADLSAFAGPGDEVPARRAADAGRLMAEAIEQMRAVTIAAIHGHCVGGGVVLAGACDLRVADEDARFSIPEVDLGIPLAWGGIPRLVREIGPAATRDLVLTCRHFGADEARSLGFVSRVVAVGFAIETAEELAASLALKARFAVESTLAAVDACAEELVGTGRAWSDADALVSGLHDAEGREAALRYLAQRSR